MSPNFFSDYKPNSKICFPSFQDFIRSWKVDYSENTLQVILSLSDNYADFIGIDEDDRYWHRLYHIVEQFIHLGIANAGKYQLHSCGTTHFETMDFNVKPQDDVTPDPLEAFEAIHQLYGGDGALKINFLVSTTTRNETHAQAKVLHNKLKRFFSQHSAPDLKNPLNLSHIVSCHIKKHMDYYQSDPDFTASFIQTHLQP